MLSLTKSRVSGKNLFIIILLFTSMCLWAQNVPQTIDYQGRLADSDGNYLNGVVTVNFLIYDVETGGAALWSETQDVSCANGIFHIQLGSVATFPSTLFDGADRWLELVVGGETLSPRTIVASVPYSIKAETAYTVEVPLNLTGNVAYPNSVIMGENTGTGYGVWGIHSSSGSYGFLGSYDIGVYGAANGFGVYGLHPTGSYGYISSSDYGVYGSHSSGNFGFLGSSSYGVYGQNYVSGGSGVYGYNTNLNGYAVYGNSTGYYGGLFEGGRLGVAGKVTPTGNEVYWGVYGDVNGGTGTNYAIYGYSYDGGTTYAGYFYGNVHVTGTFTNPSDERFKENVQPFRNALSKIKLMNVHTFNFKKMAEEKQLALPEGEQIGLIAQELEEILPQLVSDEVHAYDKNEGIEGVEKDVETIEYKGINYIGLIPVLIEAIKELNTQNEEQQRQIDELMKSAGN